MSARFTIVGRSRDELEEIRYCADHSSGFVPGDVEYALKASLDLIENLSNSVSRFS